MASQRTSNEVLVQMSISRSCSAHLLRGHISTLASRPAFFSPTIFIVPAFSSPHAHLKRFRRAGLKCGASIKLIIMSGIPNGGLMWAPRKSQLTDQLPN